MPFLPLRKFQSNTSNDREAMSMNKVPFCKSVHVLLFLYLSFHNLSSCQILHEIS